MASSYFFNGRLWTTPSVMSVVNDTAFAPTSLTVGNILCLIGQSEGGQPLQPLIFGDPATALATLISGPLCDAAVRAFAPSQGTEGPSKVVAVRVGAATAASLTLNDGTSNPVIDLTTNAYGLNANSTTIKIAAGTTTGKLVTVGSGNTYYAQDNIARNAFTIQYSGSGTGTMTISNSTVVLLVAAAPVATLALASYPTVGQLVNAINAVSGFTASVQDGQGGVTPSLNGLDTITVAQDVKTTAYTATANLQAIIDWLNSAAEPLVIATRHTNAGAVPANIGTTYFTGGTSPAPITGDWTNAFSMLQTQDVQWIVPLTSDTSVWAACDAHCQFMSGAGRKERRWMSGPGTGTTVSAAAAIPLTLNSDRGSIVYPGYYAFNAQGQRTLYAPYMTAALVAAGFAGMNPGDAMTNKPLAVNGLEVALKDPVDTDLLIQSGVLCCMQDPDGFKVVRSISTWLVNNNFNRVEVSCGAAVDFTVRNVRQALENLKGGRQDPITLGRAINETESALAALSVPEPAGPGTLVGVPGSASPPYRDIRAQITGDVLAVSFVCSPVIPTNFIPITVSIVPYSGSASSASGTVSPGTLAA